MTRRIRFLTTPCAAAMCLLAAAATAQAVDYTFSSDNISDYLWHDTNRWDPTGFPNGATDNAHLNFQRQSAGSPNMVIDLNGSNVLLNTLSFNESLISAYNPQANFTNGNFYVNNIVWKDGTAQEVDFEQNVNIFNRTSPLVISNNGWTLDFLGGVTSTNGIVVAGTRLTRIHPTNFNNTGELVLNIQRREQGVSDGTAAGFRLDTTFIPEQMGFTQTYNVVVGTLRAIGNGSLQANAKDVTGDNIFINVTNTIIDASGQGVFHFQGYDGSRTAFFTKNLEVGRNDATIRVTGNQIRIGQGGGTMTESGSGVGGTLYLDSGDFGRSVGILFDAGLTNLRTGATVLQDSIFVQLDNRSGLGSGNVVIRDRAMLNINTNLTTFPTIYLTNNGGALFGDLTGADWHSLGQNVFLSDGVTLANNIAGSLPVLTDSAVGTNRFYRGIDRTQMGTGSEAVDIVIDPVHSPWKGVAFGPFSTRTAPFSSDDRFSGDLYTTNGNPIEIMMFPDRNASATDLTAGRAIFLRPLSAADVNGPMSFNSQTNAAYIRGAGQMIFQAIDSANAIDTTFAATNYFINRIAERDVLNVNDLEFRVNTNIATGNALPSNFIVNLFNARARLLDTNAQDSIAGLINVSTGGLWYADNTGITDGRININDGGSLLLRGGNLQTNIITAGGSITTTTIFAENIIAMGGTQRMFLKTNAVDTRLILDANANVTMDMTGPGIQHMMTNMDLILSDGSSARYTNLLIGAGHRLTTALGDNFNLAATVGSGPLGHNATNQTVIISAPTLEDGERRQLSFNVTVAMEGANVQFGSTGLYETVIGGDDSRRTWRPQNGNVLVNNAFTGAVVTVAAGTLQIGDGGGPASEVFLADSITVQSGGTLAGPINPSVSGNGNIIADVTVQSGGVLGPGSAPLRSNEVSRIGTMLIGDANSAIEKNLTLQQGSLLEIQLNNQTLGGFPSLNVDTENDFILVFGALTITGATLHLSIAPDFDPFLIPTNSSGGAAAYLFAGYNYLTGTFANVYMDPGVAGYIDYDYQGTAQIAFVIPEPRTWILALFGLGLFGLSVFRPARKSP